MRSSRRAGRLLDIGRGEVQHRHPSGERHIQPRSPKTITSGWSGVRRLPPPRPQWFRLPVVNHTSVTPARNAFLATAAATVMAERCTSTPVSTRAVNQRIGPGAGSVLETRIYQAGRGMLAEPSQRSLTIRSAGKPVLKVDMPELVDGSGLPENTSPMGIREEPGQPPRELATQCK